jgi:hypothetical protein
LRFCSSADKSEPRKPDKEAVLGYPSSSVCNLRFTYPGTEDLNVFRGQARNINVKNL